MRAKHDSLATLFETFQLFAEHMLLERCGTSSNTVLTCNAIYESLHTKLSKIAPSSVASPIFFCIHTYTTYFIQRSVVIHTKTSKQLESF